MNFRELRARLIASYGRFVFFPDDPETSKVISTKAFSHLVIDEDIIVYATKAMEEQLEEELKEKYEVVYGTPDLKGEYFVSPNAKIGNINFSFRSGYEILKKAMRKPFPEELEIIKEFSTAMENALNSALSEMRIGMLLIEIKNILDCHLLKNGANSFSYPTIVAAGRDSRHVMPSTRNMKITEDKIIYLDASPAKDGYPLNFSRIIFTSERREWIESLEKINAMYLEFSNKIRAGIKCDFADAVVRRVGDFPHYSMVPSGGFYQPFAPSDCILEEGMLATVVPSIYTKEWVIRVKRNVVIRKSGVEFLI